MVLAVRNDVHSLQYSEKLQRNWAKGTCLEFLTSRLEKYKAELSESRSHANNYIDLVINEYFHHYHWKLKISEEPMSLYDSSQQIVPEVLNNEESEHKRQKVASMTKVCTIYSNLDSIVTEFVI
jgi:hypothetical protein